MEPVLRSMFDGIEHTRHEVEVDGAVVRYRRLGRRGGPSLILLHGSRAHSGWWGPTAALLAERCDLLVPDLSGHGDSDSREIYTGRRWAAEVRAVLADAGVPTAIVVGHSMGGKVALTAAALYPEATEAVVIIDSDLCEPRNGPLFTQPLPLRAMDRKTYPTAQEALARFRLFPGDNCVAPELLGPLAEQSMVQLPDGSWTWKFDPNVRRIFSYEFIRDCLAGLERPLSVLYGEHSPVMDVGTVRFAEQVLGAPVPAGCVSGSYHHVPLEAPEACANAVLAYLVRSAP